LLKEKIMAMRETPENRMHPIAKSIAVFGVGPGLGQAVARHYPQAGYAVS
jgi:hypothetical protein